MLRSDSKLKNEEENGMRFNPLQWTVIAVLSAVLAFEVWVGIKSSPQMDANLSGYVPQPVIVEIKIDEVALEAANREIRARNAALLAQADTLPTLPPEVKTGSSIRLSGSNFCTLTIKAKNITVLYGVDEKTLEKHPGWLESSALPGQDGMCVIYGHRNRQHFQVLEKVAIGDVIYVTMSDGSSYSYAISSIITYESTADWKLPAADGKSLVLVTCYPFRYSGYAPGKCVVVAVLI